jgi:hypothetical protein
MYTKNRNVTIRLGLLITTLLTLFLLAIGYQAGRTNAAPTARPAVVAQVLDVNCPFSGANIGSDFSKVLDIDTFTVQSSESLIEITFNGRIDADSMTGNGVRFELRVDDSPSPYGRARAIFRSDESTNSGGIQASITGIFDALAPGEHTLSLWALATNNGTATGVRTDPGCFSTDHAVVKEFLPFGTIALPVQLAE